MQNLDTPNDWSFPLTGQLDVVGTVSFRSTWVTSISHSLCLWIVSVLQRISSNPWPLCFAPKPREKRQSHPLWWAFWENCGKASTPTQVDWIGTCHKSSRCAMGQWRLCEDKQWIYCIDGFTNMCIIIYVLIITLQFGRHNWTSIAFASCFVAAGILAPQAGYPCLLTAKAVPRRLAAKSLPLLISVVFFQF